MRVEYRFRVQARSRGGRWCWTLKSAQKRSRAGRWGWAQKVGLLLLRLFLNSGAADIVLVTRSSTAVERAIAQCTSRWAMARGHRLNISIVLAAVHAGSLQSFSGGIRGRTFTLSSSFPLSPSLISNLASVDVKQHGQGQGCFDDSCMWKESRT